MDLETKDQIFFILSIISIVSLALVSGKYLEQKNKYLEMKREYQNLEADKQKIETLSSKLDAACKTIKSFQRLNETQYEEVEFLKDRYVGLYTNVSGSDNYIQTIESRSIHGKLTRKAPNVLEPAPWHKLDCVNISQ